MTEPDGKVISFAGILWNIKVLDIGIGVKSEPDDGTKENQRIK